MLQNVWPNFLGFHLKRVYYACPGLPYGKEDQTLLIDDEPTKMF
jgi:hypothetical protein